MCLRNLPWIALLILLLNPYGGTTNIGRCLSNKFDKQNQGCCNGQIYDKRQDGVSYSCCTGARQIYKPNEQTCCGNQMRNNSDIQNLVCCEHHFRPKDQGLCCQGIHHENKNSGNKVCCGKLSYNSHLHHCCDGKLHKKMSNGKCCATNIYNFKTHWCKMKQDILPLGVDSCYGKQFKTDTHICCFHQKHVYEKTTKTDDECCGSTPYSSKEYFCKDRTDLVSVHDSTPQKNTSYRCGMIVIDGDKQSCCNEAIPFDPLNQQCCGGQVLHRSEECCDKKKLDTSSFTCCRNEVKQEQVLKSKSHHNECCFLKNGSTETYNSNENECSFSLGAVVSNTPKCGVHTYNTTKDICCNGIFIANGNLLNLDCCGIIAYHKRNETCDGGIIKNKTSISKRTDYGPMCGMNPFNKNNDLCCSGVFTENGKTLNKSCCGIKPYFTKNQTCCDGNSLKDFDRRFRLNPCTCPSYCQQSWLKSVSNWKIWKNDKNICRYKVYSITKTHGTIWRVNKKKQRKNKKKQKIVKFEEDCTCTCGERNALILLTKRVKRSGKIKGDFYLLPNEKQYRRIVRGLKKQIRNKCNRKRRGRKNITKNHVKL